LIVIRSCQPTELSGRQFKPGLEWLPRLPLIC
jgi:hypothetical protein